MTFEMRGIRSWNASEDGPNPARVDGGARKFDDYPPPRDEVRIDAEVVIKRLEEAGATLLALRLCHPGPMGLKAYWPEFPQQAIEAYGWNKARIRPAIPAAHEVTRMDQALQWVNLIPPDRYVLRRIVGARALVSPITQRHLFSWNGLANTLGCDRRAVTRWHSQGIELIVEGLRHEPTLARSV